jgi:hypothetical protein
VRPVAERLHHCDLQVNPRQRGHHSPQPKHLKVMSRGQGIHTAYNDMIPRLMRSAFHLPMRSLIPSCREPSLASVRGREPSLSLTAAQLSSTTKPACACRERPSPRGGTRAALAAVVVGSAGAGWYTCMTCMTCVIMHHVSVTTWPRCQMLCIHTDHTHTTGARITHCVYVWMYHTGRSCTGGVPGRAYRGDVERGRCHRGRCFGGVASRRHHLSPLRTSVRRC